MRRYLVPVHGPLPIWRYGPLHNLFGEYVRDGWKWDRIYYRRFATRAEADEFIEANTKAAA